MKKSNLESKATNQPYINPTPGEITIVGLGRMRYINSTTGAIETEWYISSKAAQLLKEIGCNAAQAQLALANSPSDYPGIQNSLDACKPNNIKVNVKLGLVEGDCGSTYYTDIPWRYEHWISVWGKIAAKFKDNPALGGWFLVDEPAAATMQSFADAKSEILRNDTTHSVLVNLFGHLSETNETPEKDLLQLNGMIKANLEDTAYIVPDLVIDMSSYYDYFQQIFGPAIWSSDFYPFEKSQKNPPLKDYFYEYLLMMRGQSLKTGRPFWTYIACNFNYPTTNGNIVNAANDSSLTIGRLRFQVFMALAYGAQGINYWNIFGDRDVYNAMPVDLYGKKTVLFDIVKTVNQEVKAYNSVFCGCNVSYLGVIKNASLNDNKELLPVMKFPYEYIKAITYDPNSRWIYSKIYNNGNYLVIVSQDWLNSRYIKITFNNPPFKVRQLYKNGTQSGLLTSFDGYAEAGGVLIFKVEY